MIKWDDKVDGGKQENTMWDSIASGVGAVVFFFFAYAAFINYQKGDTTLYIIVSGMFALLISWAYVFRKKPKLRASGWKEGGIPFIVAFAVVIPFSFLPKSQFYEIGMVIAGVGLIFALWGMLYLGSNFSIAVEARRLVTGGPYKIVRHPVYAGEILCYAGLALAFLSWVSVLTLVFLVAGQLYRSLLEEKKLYQAFGEDYKRMQAQTWWPVKANLDSR